MSDIRFYTHQTKPGELAQFQLYTRAPWGAHSVRGSIIQSQETNEPTVVWPKCGRWFASTPATREETDAAALWILDRWKLWSNPR